MCQKRITWRQYTFSILFLIAGLASNSNQQKHISSSRSFQRYSKAVGEENDGFVPITTRTVYKPASAPLIATPSAPLFALKHEKSYTELSSVIPQADRRIDDTDESQETDDKNVNYEKNENDEREAIRSINHSLQELEEMTMDFLTIIKQNNNGIQKRSTDQTRSFITDYLLNENVINRVKKFTEKYILSAVSGSALQNIVPADGRLFLFKGFKKLMWPIFIAVQVAKTVLLAMFLPSIIGSIGKMVGKGLLSSSGVGHPSETVDDFEFKDNPLPEEPASTGVGYNYPQQTQLTANHANVEQNAYDTAPAANNMLSLYDIADSKPQFSFANTYPMPDYAQNSRKETLQSKKDDFKLFHDIPASSMLLTNYDPFYSPLLSRLDAVFQQLNLGIDNESCREKLVCLMYASPAKYMPYSNLVSAQLSRELNELRKPTSDNVEILRFFKYMRAARDGQDGKNCHNIHKKCSNSEDTDQPAMLTTFNDINKLVQARKMH